MLFKIYFLCVDVTYVIKSGNFGTALVVKDCTMHHLLVQVLSELVVMLFHYLQLAFMLLEYLVLMPLIALGWKVLRHFKNQLFFN